MSSEVVGFRDFWRGLGLGRLPRIPAYYHRLTADNADLAAMVAPIVLVEMEFKIPALDARQNTTSEPLRGREAQPPVSVRLTQ
jgi:hypothetical protein